MIWSDSPHCKTRAHCRACLADPAFHAVMAKDWEMPQLGTCPHGVTVDNLPEPQAIASTPRETPPGQCPLAVRDCCGKPYICGADGGECPDRFNISCGKRPDPNK